MGETLKKMTAEYEFRKRRRTGAAIFYVLILCLTVAVMILPAVTLSKKEVVMDCPLTVHKHSASCYQENEDGEKVLICGLADYVVHTHDEFCYDDDGNLICSLPEIEEHIHTDKCYSEEKELICGKDEVHTHDESCFDADGNLICGKPVVEAHQHDESCVKCVEASEEDSKMKDSQVDEPETESAQTDEPGTQNPEVMEADEPEARVAETGQAGDPETESQENNDKQALTWEESTDTVTVYVEADWDAFPEGTTMRVKDVDDEETVQTVSETVDREIASIRAVDISFYDVDGKEVEPGKPIRVSMTTKNNKESKTDLAIVHVDDTGKANEVKEVDVNKKNKGKEMTATFEADQFSVYAVVYTVDFHYEINGKMYDFSIPGGSFVSLEHVVEVLGIATGDENGEIGAGDGENSTACEEAVKLNEAEVSEATKKFVANVESVEFSSPELVWVGKVDEATTIGELKEANGLEVQSSAELTEEQIMEINAQTIDDGDWALISLQPFTSDETLTVTMENGDRWSLHVTDFVFGAFPHDVKIDIIGNGSIELTEYVSDPANFMNDEEVSKIYFSARTVPLSLSYFYRDTNNYTAANNHDIIAHPGEGYVFDHWEKNGQRLTGPQFASETITAGSLYLSYTISDTLTAVFRKTNNGGGGNINIDDIIQAWMDNMTKDQPVVDKTAAVYDYENRIYQIDITASSEFYAISQDLDIDFVTDVSRSMLFPSKLDPVKTFTTASEFIEQLNAAARERHKGYLPDNTDPGERYYIILQPQGASDVYVVRRYGGKWWRLPASKSEAEINANVIRGGSYDVWRELDGHVGDDNGKVVVTSLKYSYGHPVIDNKIYTATDETDRLEYLKQALNLVKQVLYKVDPDAKIGLTTFAKTANAGRFYANTEQNALDYAIANISVDDNTDQAAGLAAGKTLLDSDTDPTKKKVVVLITDGAPNAPETSPYAPLTWDKIQGVAQGIKNEGIDIYTVGLSLENVQGASEGLFYTSSNSEAGKHGYAFDARDGVGLVEAIQSIIESVVVKASMTGSVTDVIDPAFYPVDKDGNPLQAGVEYEDEQGHKYTLTQTGNTWTVNWTDQEFKWAYTDEDNVRQPGWKGTIYVKAKEDFLGGNRIKTNSGTGNDKVVASGYSTILGVDEHDVEIPGKSGPLKNENGTLKTITKTLATPHVNVDELQLTDEDTEWTVYVDATVDPMLQLKNLYKNIDISEVVTQTDTDHRRAAAGALNPDHDGDSETFPLTDITGELTNTQWNTLLGGGTITVPYGTENPSDRNYAYGHKNVGSIQISLIRTYAAGENQIASSTETGHTANKTGGKVEQYTLTARYVPDTTGASTTYDHVPDGMAGAVTENMTSENKHDITVIRRGIKVTKVDMVNTNQTLTGAKFALYRADPNGTADVSEYKLPAGNYTLLQSNLEVDGNGVITFDPLKPDQKPGNNPRIYLPDNPVGNAAASHDTLYYLVETSPAAGGYVLMPGAVCFTLNLQEGKTDVVDRTASYHGRNYKNGLTLYNWTQAAEVTATEHGNGTTQYLIPDNGTDEILAFKLKNARPTDITLIKVDKNTGESIGGAKFTMNAGMENIDFSGLTITKIKGGGTVSVEDFEYNQTTIKVITVPEGGVRIAGLPDNTYTLREVTAPAGYIITDNAKTFITENGSIKNEDGSIHTDEATGISFKVENEPGAALPNTGGPGTRLFTILGSILVLGAGVLLWRRRKLI